MGNMFKTAFLLTALTLLLMFFGRYFGGQNGMFLALAFAAVMNFVSYFFSDKIALAMYRRPAGHARGTAARLRRRRAPHAENRHPDAEDLRDPDRVAQRLRHRTQSAATPRSP